jgi:hypothetical protein
MNERIKELAHQAEFISKRHNGDEWRWGYIDPELNSKLEKFAELIVADCLDVVAMRIYLGPAEICRQECKALASEIKEHFGVEE